MVVLHWVSSSHFTGLTRVEPFEPVVVPEIGVFIFFLFHYHLGMKTNSYYKWILWNVLLVESLDERMYKLYILVAVSGEINSVEMSP